MLIERCLSWIIEEIKWVFNKILWLLDSIIYWKIDFTKLKTESMNLPKVSFFDDQK